MSIGWFSDLADAEAYFTDERLETYAWDDLDADSGSNLKEKVVRNAYNRLYHDPRWTLPTYAEATAAELVKLRIVNAEMSYYLALHMGDEDRRKGIQAQAVIEAGIVKERYDPARLSALPIPAVVEAMLEPWSAVSPIGFVELKRDDEEGIER